MLAQAEMADVIMAPAADMFEMGVDVQVLRRGSLFAVRARKLYELYRAWPSLEAIPASEREKVERDMLRNTILSFLTYIDANRASWIVLYTQATSSQAFAHTVRDGRERIVDLVARLLSAGTRNPEPDTDFHMMAIALVGAGEAVATRVSTGDVDVDDAAELLINLFWRGLKGRPSTDGVAAEAESAARASN